MKNVDVDGTPVDIGNYVFVSNGSKIAGGVVKKVNENIFFTDGHTTYGQKFDSQKVKVIK